MPRVPPSSSLSLMWRKSMRCAWRPLMAYLAMALLLGSTHAAVKHHARKHASQNSRATSGTPFGATPDVLQLADTLAQRHQLPRAWVRQQLGTAQFLRGVPKLVLPPPVSTPKNWRAYRERFIEPRRISAGVAFWQTYRSALEKAEATYGVPAEMVVGILGVETFYGQHMGNYRVLDALATLAPTGCRTTSVLSIGVGALSGANAPTAYRGCPHQRQLCRSHGLAAVHAVQLGAICGGL